MERPKEKLVMKPYRLKLVQALSAADNFAAISVNFSFFKWERIKLSFLFSDKATFNTNGKVNWHNIRIKGTQNPLEIFEQECDSPKHDGAPLHWHLSVRDYLNVNYPRLWIGRQAARAIALHHWPSKKS
ncbi:hypothetical protein J6590_088683 [Homalodisca vitripennis]|nr:hypothetical protein J6590_088683 [Homalodisca vitripennis]